MSTSCRMPLWPGCLPLRYALTLLKRGLCIRLAGYDLTRCWSGIGLSPAVRCCATRTSSRPARRGVAAAPCAALPRTAGCGIIEIWPSFSVNSPAPPVPALRLRSYHEPEAAHLWHIHAPLPEQPIHELTYSRCHYHTVRLGFWVWYTGNGDVNWGQRAA